MQRGGDRAGLEQGETLPIQMRAAERQVRLTSSFTNDAKHRPFGGAEGSVAA
jgi:hypothetical protein